LSGVFEGGGAGVSGFDEHGAAWPGKVGRYEHHGDPLTVEQILALPDGQEVIVTWPGGNGPHRYHVVREGDRVHVDNCYRDPLLRWPDSKVPLVRVTLP
jgi:hypothetical protein